MKQIFPLILIFVSCTQVSPRPSFNEFDFYFDNTFETAFAIKFTSTDTVYVVRYFPYPKQFFRGMLTKGQREKIDSFIRVVPFESLDTLYYEGYQDGIRYQFYVKEDSLEKSVVVHSDNVPEGLVNFASWILKTKISLKLDRVDMDTDFNHADYFIFPPPTLKPEVKFTPPRVTNDQ